MAAVYLSVVELLPLRAGKIVPGYAHSMSRRGVLTAPTRPKMQPTRICMMRKDVTGCQYLWAQGAYILYRSSRPLGIDWAHPVRSTV